MARRLPAAARAQPPWAALRLELPALRARRAWGIAAAILAAIALAYVVARETPLFAVQHVSVSGASPRVARDVRAALRSVGGSSLVKVDAGALERRLADLPSVVGATVDRAFPHDLDVVVQPERPVGLLRAEATTWVVSARGVVIRAWTGDDDIRLPRIGVGDDASDALAPGSSVGGDVAQGALRVLDRIPATFPVHVRRLRIEEGTVRLGLGHGRDLRLGSEERLGAKIAAAAAVLASLPVGERRSLAYLDVSLPERPVASVNTQVEGES